MKAYRYVLLRKSVARRYLRYLLRKGSGQNSEPYGLTVGLGLDFNAVTVSRAAKSAYLGPVTGGRTSGCGLCVMRLFPFFLSRAGLILVLYILLWHRDWNSLHRVAFAFDLWTSALFKPRTLTTTLQ